MKKAIWEIYDHMALFIDLSQAMSATDQKQLRLHFHYYEVLHFELENKYADFFLTSVNENVETHVRVTTTWQISR